MLIHTGDVQPNCQLYPDLKRTTTEEIASSLALRLSTKKTCQENCGGSCVCVLGTNTEHTGLPVGIPKENINLQVKLFISEKTTKENIVKAVDSVLQEFSELDQVDQLFISTADKTNKDLLLKCWPWLEDLAKAGKVKHLGLSDPRCQTIQPLIESCKIWPKSIQLLFKCENLSDTCIDLLKLANYYKIRATIHRDDLTNMTDLKANLKSSLGVSISESWLAKYSMFDAKRKVILKKGYLVEMENLGNHCCSDNTITE
ncbi:glutamate--cysteine ligase regulatory subunit-like isoform X1 [Bolinopsis microptera]|uniref:glutamate--cysteine ligase regulatory subunit-like isoform X1 n=1 Tax=Bolinopsis microptera TaxID=2820187 RepID=UPI00307A1245